LIASPILRDPNFARTVVLLCEHDEEEGSMGLVVNRPSDLTLGQTIEGFEDDATQKLWVGGPVQRDVVLVLHRNAAIPGARPVVDGMALGGEPDELLALLRGARWSDVRVFSGYAGWGAGQLQRELAERSWIVCPARADFVFDSDPDGTWSALLRFLGPRYAYLATIPLDPRVN
jgi:putative transcriptional regulator